MKSTKPLFTTFLMLVCAMLSFTVANAQTYDVATSETEGTTYVRYTGDVDMTADGDSIASHYTQALYIGDSNQGTAVLQLDIPDSTGTEDINVFVEFSQDRLSWTSISTAVIDAATNGTTYDTLSTVGGTALIEYSGSTWMRLHYDGQTGNPELVLNWSAYLPKSTGAPPRGVPNVADRRQ